MIKNLKNLLLIPILMNCSSKENLVDGKIQIEKVFALNPPTIEKLTNATSKTIDLSSAKEISTTSAGSILKKGKSFFFIPNFADRETFDIKKILFESSSAAGNEPDIGNGVESLLFFEGKQFAVILDEGNIRIAECVEDKSYNGSSSNDLDKIKLLIKDDIIMFNPNDRQALKKSFIYQLRPRILRQLSKQNQKINLSDIDIDNINISFKPTILSCSNCTLQNKRCVVILAPCDVITNGAVVELNIFFIFDGKALIPCIEAPSDNSYFNGAFEDFSFTSIKCATNKIALEGIYKAEKNFSNLSSLCLGEVKYNEDGHYYVRLISSNPIENLKSFTFLKTEGNYSLLTALCVDDINNKVEYRRLVNSEFSSQTAHLIGASKFDIDAKTSDTNLRDYNMVFLNDNYILLQPKSFNFEDRSLDNLLTINKLSISKV